MKPKTHKLEKRKRKRKTMKRKRRGGNKKKDPQWETGFWDEKPVIHAKFTDEFTAEKKCDYGLFWNYHYLVDADDSPSLEGEKEKKIKTTKKLQLFTDSKDLPGNNCTLPKTKILGLLMDNTSFKKKVEKGKESTDKEIKEEQSIRKIFTDKKTDTEEKFQGNQDKFQEIKEHRAEKKSRRF